MYESDVSTATSALKAGNTTVFNDATISRILSLSTSITDTSVNFSTTTPDANGVVTVASGTEVVLVQSSNTAPTTIAPPVNAPVVVFEGKGGVVATFNDGANVPSHAAGVTDRIVIGSAGNDHIILADARNTQVTLGTGNSTVVTGSGSDTVVAGLGNSTVIGGTGHAIVQLKGNADDYTVTVNNGHAVVTHAGDGLTTDISKIQFVQLDNGKALVFAKDSAQAAVSTLYSAAFGRDADGTGLQFYFDAAKSGKSLTQIADFFLKSSEGQTLAAKSDADFINDLYHNTFNRTGEAGGLAFWADQLSHGTTRAQVLAAFVNVAGQNLDDALHTEAVVVGSVTVIHNII